MNIIDNKQRKWKGRYTVLLLLWLGWLFSFLDRMVMNISLPFIGVDLQIDKAVQGSIISAFFIGYALFQIPGGYLADKFGPKKVMAFAIIWWSFFTFLTGLIYFLPLMLLVRFLFGAGEGSFPASSWKVISTYFPSKERGRATAIQASVNTLGPAASVLIAATIIELLGWREVFLILSIPGIILSWLIYRFVHNEPNANKLISIEELKELEDDKKNNIIKSMSNSETLSFVDVLKKPILWKLSLVWFLFDITFWGFTTWLPSYLLEVRLLSLSKTGIWAAIPFLFGALGTLTGGYFSDKFQNKLNFFYGISAIISGLFLFLMFRVESIEAAILFQCISSFFMFVSFAIFWGMVMHLIPSEIMGRASSIVNFGGQVAGVISPVIIGFLIDTEKGGYENAFIFMVIALILSAILTFFIQKMKL